MRNGSCKFGAECKFNHPDPTTVGGTDSLNSSFHGNNGGSFSPKSTFQPSSNSWSSPRHATGTTPFVPSMLSQSRGVPSQTPEWNGYQVVKYFLQLSIYLSTRTIYDDGFGICLGFCVFIRKECVFSFHHIPYEQFISCSDKHVLTVPTC